MKREQPGPMQLRAVIEERPLAEPFHITGYTFSEFDALVVSLTQGGHVGKGEAEGVYYHHETAATMLDQILAIRERIEDGISREDLLTCLPAGGARNAIDCALWDLEAKRNAQPAWKLAGLDAPKPLITTFTVGVDDPQRVAEAARRFGEARALKLKLGEDDRNAERVRALRAARPDVWLMVDANQGLTRSSLVQLLPTLEAARVQLIEQPFPIGKDDWLDDFESPIPIAADESVQDRSDLRKLVGRVHTINIKLDKSGGLTEALFMAKRARELGFDLMVGNMSGTSLAIAPAFLLGQCCSVADLDGPAYLRQDCTPSATYSNGMISCPAELWGGPSAAA